MIEERYITHLLVSSIGSSEQSKVELVADTETGETELVIRKTIIERYPVTDYKKVMDLHESLNRGGGRRVWKLYDLTK